MRGSKEAAMTVDARWESLYQQVQLVRGVGDRKRGKMCIMSFVAFLAGEDHSDKPVTASPLIRQFAIIINDEMPDTMRQRLKSFAPRILGTRDGKDPTRAQLLMEVARVELLPRIVREFGSALVGDTCARPRSQMHQKEVTLPQAYEQAVSLVASAPEQGNLLRYEEPAAAVARLIALCGRMAATQDERDWYWLKAIELLDRLCDADNDRLRFPAERLPAMQAFLERRNEQQQRKARTVAALARVRNFIPALIR
jgi:hypothetical protein